MVLDALPVVSCITVAIFPCTGRSSQNSREALEAVVLDAVLPLMPAVLEEEDPMPLYALKLLVVLLDNQPTWAKQLQQ